MISRRAARLVSSLAVFLLLLLLLPLAVRAQGDAAPLVAALPQGGFAAFKLAVLPIGAGVANSAKDTDAMRLPLTPQVLTDEGGGVRRVLLDERGRLVFGYELVAVPLVGGGFSVAARPLAPAFFAARAPQHAAMGTRAIAPPSAVLTLARATEARVVVEGETFALDLLINEQLGLKVLDYVKVARERSRLFAAPAPSSLPPRDFSVTNVELAVKDFRLLVDGQARRDLGVRRSCAGSLLWFSVPGRGRFIVALAPRAGYDFRKTGMLADDRISFTHEGVRYEWQSAEPIVRGGGAWHLWVLHDPAYAESYTPPPADQGGEESATARALRDPLGALTHQGGKPSQQGLRAPPTVRPALPATGRVRIGGALNIEELLPLP